MLEESTLAGSTLEILSLLAVAFLLGYLLKLLFGNKWKALYTDLETENYKLTNELASNNSQIKSLEDSNNFLRSELEKAKKAKQTFTAPIRKPINPISSNGEKPVQSPSIKPIAKPAIKTPEVQEKKVVAQPLKSSTNSSIKKTSPKPKKTKVASKAPTPKKSKKKDDLKKIEGIGPKIEQIFNKAGLKSFDDLAGSTPTKLKKILSEAGPRYKMHDPKTWPRQAKLASSGNWKRLKTLQDSLEGGKLA